MALEALGPEVHRFLGSALGDDVRTDDAFAETSERFWRSLARFEWRCSLRTWLYVIARREASRVRSGEQKRARGRVRISELADLIAKVTSKSRTGGTRRTAIARLRDELPADDRDLLILRVDRELSWEEIACAFLEDEAAPAESVTREAARLRKRFQLVKDRIAVRAREEGLLGKKG